MTAAEIEQHLRAQDRPVIARIQDDRVVLDVRTVLSEELEELATLKRPTA
jgi:seryl-tRNA(Sec) selenium transferase